jgi:arsenite-transporting ATPase
MADAYLVVNGVLPQIAGEEPIAAALREHEAAALAALPATLALLPRDTVDLKAGNIMGHESLRTFFDPAAPEAARDGQGGDVQLPDAPLAALVDEIEADGHGLVMCMGKGGVGKTTVAAAVAIALAARGHDVLLTTTDPAAHLDATLAGSADRLAVARIDPAAALQQYRDRVMEAKGRGLDEAARAALAEDLQSPCTAEVAVFQQFSRAVHDARRRFVVMDTAPTGHTLLLLDTAGSYHREVSRQMGEGGAGFVTPLMRLQDPSQTKVILVTLAETTPVLEAAALQQDLERAGIHPWAWVVNNSIAAARPESAFLRARAGSEAAQIARVQELADRVALIPLLPHEPVGIDRLAALTEPAAQPA